MTHEAYRQGVEDSAEVIAKAHPTWAAEILKLLRATMDQQIAAATVDLAIVENVLPQVAFWLDTMISHLEAGTQPSKKALMEARKLLPAWCDNTLVK